LATRSVDEVRHKDASTLPSLSGNNSKSHQCQLKENVISSVLVEFSLL
jgi:hypothetical protein